MLITDQNKAISARKHAMAFHTRHGIKSVAEMQPHALTWAEINAVEKDARKEASAMIDRTEAGSDEQRASLENAVDRFSDLLEAIRSEKDERTLVGSKEPRGTAETAAQLASRPKYAPAVCHTDDSFQETEAAIALRSDQSMRSWAKARSPVSETLRGMDAGRFLRAMVVQDKTDAERRALSEATDSAGGFTVPDMLSAELIDKARAASVVMQAGARTVPLTSDKNTIAKVLTDPTPAWRAEAGTVANSDGTFGAVVLVPRSRCLSNKLSADFMQRL